MVGGAKEMISFLRRFRRTTIIILLIIFYALSYFLVMVREFPSVDDSGKPEFRSSFRFSRELEQVGPLSIFHPRTSFWNYFYLPADGLYYVFQGKKPTVQ